MPVPGPCIEPCLSAAKPNTGPDTYVAAVRSLDKILGAHRSLLIVCIGVGEGEIFFFSIVDLKFVIRVTGKKRAEAFFEVSAVSGEARI